MALDLIDIVAGVLGLGCLGLAVSTTRKGWQLATARPIGSETEAEDIVRVSGTVAPADDELVAPLSGTSCVAYVLAHESYYLNASTPIKRWHKGGTVGEIRPFSLETPAGTILVDMEYHSEDNPFSEISFGNEPPGGRLADTRLDVDERSRKFAAGESPPSSVLDAFYDRLPEAKHPHRYSEWRIESGDTLSVIGKATRHNDPRIRNKMGISNADTTFIISEHGHRRTLFAFVRRTVLYLSFGVPMLGLLVYRLWETLA